MSSAVGSKEFSLKNPLILALDVDTDKEALQIAEEMQDLVGAIKIGPRLALRYGQSLSQKISKNTLVFLDNKHFDIPTTMEAAALASFDAGASLVTIHALSGVEACERLAALEKKLSEERAFKILAVTVLTSWDQQSLPSNMQGWGIQQHVETMVESIRQAGLTGIVCSAHELQKMKTQGLFVVTPGLQFGTQNEDQKRTMTPAEALSLGASGLVVGRSILNAKNRREAVLDILKSLTP